MRFHLFIQLAWLSMLNGSCTQIPPSMEEREDSSSTDQGPGPIYLTDRNGERFDITYAVKKYGMSRNGFEHGIGKNTIRPLDHPGMIAPGELAYPNARDDAWIIGAEIDGDGIPPVHLFGRQCVHDAVGAYCERLIDVESNR